MSTMQEYLSKSGPVLLEAFGHQVGGHSLLMKFEHRLCKPLLPREHFFYESIPQAIRNFTPAYYGVMTVCFERRPSGEIQLFAHPKRGKVDRLPGPLAESLPMRLKCTSGGALPLDTVHGKEIGNSYMNPWSAQCVRNTRDLLQGYGHGLQEFHQDYVVFEDLTLKYQHPCVLDMKIGTRQHGDDVSEEKRRQHMERCAHSTSQKLGVRICGMQKYDVSKQGYMFRDKYYGRMLTEEGFYDALRCFLHNGVHFRADILPRLVAMLKEVREVVRKQDSYRFFSSSLLVIYDGKEDVSPTTNSHLGEPPRDHILQDSCLHSQSRDREYTPPSLNNSEDNHRMPFESVWPDSRSDLTEARQFVDVRMIDFAHTTHKGCVHDIIQYTGPDDGYIVGLNTLISAFEEMQEQCL